MMRIKQFSVNLTGLAFLLCFSSCGVWRHVTTEHNTPNFTDKNQSEINTMVSWTGFDLSTAYSPLKYFAMQLNSRAASTDIRRLRDTGKAYNFQLEGGLTAYLPMKRFTLGITAGYGIGSTRWLRWYYVKESSREDYYSLYDTKKIFLNPYIIYKWKHQPNYSGISIKVNMLNEYYYKTTSDKGTFPRYNYLSQTFAYELQYFIRLRISDWSFARFDFGAAVTTDAKNVYLIGGVGLVFKIPKSTGSTSGK